ncbi:YY1-associated protein 1 [Dissostichus eleginoides]|uniref:YY1-associated protein 1 n=1 Tax=Dissostichus eleginoides TaxID=100907 RepID=A0AAD9C7W5_DISEL|nr:YY1-associated protein 1 [Dissostichus eleginoides]
MFVDVFCVAALMLCCSRLSVALHLSNGRSPARSPSLTEHTFPTTASKVSHPAPHYAPCFVDDIFAALRESVGNDDELTNSSVYQFGVCTASERSSVLLQLAKETRRNHRDGLEVLPPTGVILAEENERGALLLTFDLLQSPLLKPNPVLLLVFESPLTGGNLDVTFTKKTQYIMLTGKASEGGVHHRWRMSIETKKPDMNQSLRDILIGGKSGSTTSMTPLLLFSGEGGTETRYTQTSSPASSQTSFLCELKRFLGDVPPQDPPDFPALQLDSLDSLPPLMLDLSSSDTLLAELINSSSQTIFSFPNWGSMFQVYLGELAMSPALLQEVKQRLQQTVTQVTEVIETEGEVGCSATKRLRRLTELSAFPEKEPAAGDVFKKTPKADVPKLCCQSHRPFR